MAAVDGTGNQILDALPVRIRQTIQERARCVNLSPASVVFDQSRPITTVHFPVTAVLSILTPLRDGTAIEASTIGNEGTTGFPLLLGVHSLHNARCICQIPGEAIALPAFAFREEVERQRELDSLGRRYVSVLLTQMGQGVACSRHHQTVSRCARWLLQTHDRVASDVIRFTHEFLSIMLGTRRASVTDALAMLVRGGMISTGHGRIEVKDRFGLEAVACECYEVVRDAIGEMLTITDSESEWSARG